ncbi:MAG: polysaccharide deacetylase family protein [Terracidiphilus sp.]
MPNQKAGSSVTDGDARPAAAGARANGLADLPALSRRGVPRPAGAVGGLKILDWAGFSSAITYTFDDSLASQLANYPQLHATGIRMTFFQVSGTGDKAGWQQVVDDGNELGNHTAHHCHAGGTGCGWGTWAGSAAAEYHECNEFLKQSYGVGNVWDTATPYGDTGFDATATTLFFLNRGVWGGQIAPNGSADPYNLPIYGAVAGDTAAAFDARIDSAHKAGKWQIFLVHSLGGDGGYAPINPAGLLASIRYAKSFGDVWQDDMVNVGAYWEGQKAVTDATISRAGKAITVRWTLPAHFPPGRHVRVTVTGGSVKQGGVALAWNSAGYYEVALDAGSLTITP